MKKEVLKRIVMALILSIGVSQWAFADFYAGGIYFMETSYNTVAVIESPDGYSGEITIPETVTVEVSHYYEMYERTYTVTAISEGAFRDCEQLTRVNLPSTIYEIEDNAFYGCTALTDITIPSSVEVMGDAVFGYCTSLQSAEIPASVYGLGWNTFYCCSSLTSVTLPPYLSSLNGTFFGCTSLKSVELPEYLLSLDGTFTGCTSLETVVVPSLVETIGERTFDGCAELTMVVLPASLTFVGEQAFRGCDKLESVTVQSATPPTMNINNGEYFTDWVYENAKLYVPGNSITKYGSTNWWNLFQHIYGLLSMNKKAAMLAPGATLQLDVVFAPGFGDDLQVNWLASDEEVVTVTKDGLVEALSVGDAFIYAQAGSETAVCEIRVRKAGDLNGDSEVNIADINTVIDAILGGGGNGPDSWLYDVNGDGEVNIADVTAIISLIFQQNS